MGPGHEYPGKQQLAVSAKLDMVTLQWGRGMNTPENVIRFHSVCIRYMLQWGRGMNTPENNI